MEKPPNRVLVCNNCGHIFLDISGITRADLVRYYESFRTYGQPMLPSPGSLALNRHRSRWMVENMGQAVEGLRALDVGCGHGAFLLALDEQGLIVTGNETSPELATFVAETHGYPVINQPAETLHVETPYDIVSLVKVIEHLWSPRETLEALMSAITERGWLYVEVPDGGNPHTETLADFYAFDHLHHFTSDTLGDLLNSLGFDIVAMAQEHYGTSSGNPAPSLRVLGRRSGRSSQAAVPAMPGVAARNRALIEEYRRAHGTFVTAYAHHIDNIADEFAGEPCGIFCGGRYTEVLFERFDLSRLNISCIFDNDPALTGRNIGGMTIRRGDDVEGSGLKNFLVCTTNHQAVIKEFLERRVSEPTIRFL